MTAPIQQASGPFVPTDLVIEVGFPEVTRPTSRVVVFFCGNTLISAPEGAGFELRNSQVNAMGQYLWDGPGGAQSWDFTDTVGGGGVWYAEELADGVFDGVAGSNGGSGDAYATESVIPTAGDRRVLACVGSTTASGGVWTSIAGWSNGFLEQAENGSNLQDSPMGAVAVLEIEADGLAPHSTTATFASTVSSRTGIIAAYALSEPTLPVNTVIEIVDSITAVDAHGDQAVGFGETVTDTLAVPDQVIPRVDALRALVDPAAIADLVQVSHQRTQTVVDTIGLADTVTAGRSWTIEVIDALSILDSVVADLYTIPSYLGGLTPIPQDHPLRALPYSTSLRPVYPPPG